MRSAARFRLLALLPLLVLVSVLALTTDLAPAGADDGDLQEYELRWLEDPAPDVLRNKQGTGGAV